MHSSCRHCVQSTCIEWWRMSCPASSFSFPEPVDRAQCQQGSKGGVSSGTFFLEGSSTVPDHLKVLGSGAQTPIDRQAPLQNLTRMTWGREGGSHPTDWQGPLELGTHTGGRVRSGVQTSLVGRVPRSLLTQGGRGWGS